MYLKKPIVKFKPLMALLPLCIFVGLFTTGCTSLSEAKRVVFVEEEGGFVRLGPDVTGRVYTWNGDNWVLSNNKIKIPEGWYAGSVGADSKEGLDKTKQPSK
jgi:hypothetical protein